MNVYFARCGQNIKIGIAADVAARLSSLRVGSASPVELIAAVKGDSHLEQKLHENLENHRVRGEWFNDCPEVRGAIEEVIKTSDITPPKQRKSRGSLFGPMAKLCWPINTDAHIATIAKCDPRTARRYLSGEIDPPGIVWATMWLFAMKSREPES